MYFARPDGQSSSFSGGSPSSRRWISSLASSTSCSCSRAAAASRSSCSAIRRALPGRHKEKRPRGIYHAAVSKRILPRLLRERALSPESVRPPDSRQTAIWTAEPPSNMRPESAFELGNRRVGQRLAHRLGLRSALVGVLLLALLLVVDRLRV